MHGSRRKKDSSIRNLFFLVFLLLKYNNKYLEQIVARSNKGKGKGEFNMAKYLTSEGLARVVSKIIEITDANAQAVVDAKAELQGNIDTKVDIVEGSSLVPDAEITKLGKIALDEAGVISVDNLPDTAFERCVTVDSEEAKNALTTDRIQNGDTVRVEVDGATPIMYMVVDESKLGTEQAEEAFKVYASITDWSTVRNIPTKVITPTALDVQVNGVSIATYTGNEDDTVVANIMPDAIGLSEITNEDIDALFVKAPAGEENQGEPVEG